MKTLDLSLYLVTDKSDDVEKFLKTIEEAIKGGVSVVQIREKTADTLDFYNLALKVKEITEKQLPVTAVFSCFRIVRRRILHIGRLP